jgi:hypothetical protein
LSPEGVVFAPLLLMLFALSPVTGLAASAGIVLAAASATAIQYWHRLQVHRRRQTASRFTTYAEALAPSSWAPPGNSWPSSRLVSRA